ncbi:methyl-accepting chemotaxis protein [Pseudomonas sp. UL073]|uniref:Methyl-accepting chemotaxis protein n=1 Tax=Zestomonas insulae TaxID=2809017 RepID=A0ABS2IHP5_9GAMM|nr:methyl-accepting chemotaxis protein [Pseudomonas insulae]MBM7062188.1 methyl-accepting chemotaxis protein [Pseudomonas insulae]
MTLRNISIAVRATLGFGLVAVLTLALGAYALLQMTDMREQADQIKDDWLPGLMTLNHVGQNVQRVRALTLRLVINRDEQALRQNSGKLNGLKAEVHEAMQAYERTILLPEDRELFARFREAEAGYMALQTKVMDLSAQGLVEDATAIINGEMNQHADAMSLALAKLSELNDQGAKAAAAKADEVFVAARTKLLVVMALAFVLTFSLATMLTRSIVVPLKRAVQVAEIVATGNLTTPVEVDGQDETARLLGALRSMQLSLRETVLAITESSNQLASASEELSAVTENASRGLQQQNTEIEQAATAINQMTSAVEDVARNAVSTSEASRESDRTAQHGRDQVVRTVGAIGDLAAGVTTTAEQIEQLAERVRGISKVLDVIRSVAEQTNLLALNAAIEAARAGEAGRGFAVVADEVRGLAHRTQQSTQEIEQMIGAIQSGTDQAVIAMQGSNQHARSTLEVAQSAGQALEHIASAFTQINERNLVIASASEQQAQVAREVDRNLTNIRDLSLQSSAGAHQTSAASQELSRLAVGLNAMVARFSV